MTYRVLIIVERFLIAGQREQMLHSNILRLFQRRLGTVEALVKRRKIDAFGVLVGNRIESENIRVNAAHETAFSLLRLVGSQELGFEAAVDH